MTGKPSIEEKMIFMMGQTGDGMPLIVFGVTRASFEYMADGKTHKFDFSKMGMPFRMMAFGCEDHAAGMKMIEAMAAKAGVTLVDNRRASMNIKPIEP